MDLLNTQLTWGEFSVLLAAFAIMIVLFVFLVNKVLDIVLGIYLPDDNTKGE